MEKKNIGLTNHDYLLETPIKNGKHFHLSLSNYSKKIRDDETSTNLINNNVLSIFSYSLRYMDKKSLNKWLKRNIKAPFYDTFVPKNKPIAYIRFRNYEELKTFEKLVENKQFHKNDNMSIIKIHKSENMSRKRKLNGISSSSPSKRLERKKFKKERRERKEKREKDEPSEKGSKFIENTLIEREKLLDLQSIIKINKETKNKTVENYVTPFYKYPYADQIRIKHAFLKKCKGQILKNLQKKWEKQNILFGNIECNSNGIFEEPTSSSSNGIAGKHMCSNENNSISKTNERTNKRNETSSDSCLKTSVVKGIANPDEVSKECSIEKRVKQYDIEVDEPVFPDESGRYAYRNKCEFTIAYDEKKNVEIGFVVRKLKQNVSESNSESNVQEDGTCNFSENNISDNNANSTENTNFKKQHDTHANNKDTRNNNNKYNDSPMNETQTARMRNKKIKDAYFLNPVVESVDNCLHIQDCMKHVVKCMKEIIKDSTYPVFDRVYKTGVWRLLIVRTTSKKELLITVQTYLLDQKRKREVKKLLINRLTKEVDETRKYFSDYKVVSLYLQEHESANDSTNESMNEHLWGEEVLEEIILNNRFLISPAAFFQVNRISCELLYSRVIKYIKIDKNKKNYIFDLCCGTGTIAICVAKALEGEDDIKVIGIELCEESIECANKNTMLNWVNNCKFITGRIEDAFPKEIKNIKDKNANIIVIVDPPRCGLANSVINTMTNASINQIIYVSCNPITMVQNVSDILFQNEKMRLKNMTLVDMFPHTFHVECIVNLLKQ